MQQLLYARFTLENSLIRLSVAKSREPIFMLAKLFHRKTQFRSSNHNFQFYSYTRHQLPLVADSGFQIQEKLTLYLKFQKEKKNNIKTSDSFWLGLSSLNITELYMFYCQKSQFVRGSTNLVERYAFGNFSMWGRSNMPLT